MAQLGEWTVDLARSSLVGTDEVRRLTTREAALLGFLLAHPRQDLSRETLLAEVWGYAPTALTRAVDHTMRRLRAKLGDDPDAPRHLITVHGVGYRLEPTAETRTAPMAAPARAARVMRLGPDVVDMDRHVLERADGRTAQLTSQEVRILDVLAERMPEPVERDDLFRLVWGLRSAGPSRAVDHAMTRLRRKIERDPQAPVHLKSVRGSGYLLEGVLSIVAPVARPILAADPSAFVGRELDLTRLGERIAKGGARLLTLVGTGGMGKTRLAHELARTLTDRAVFFCDLAAADDLWSFLSAVGAALDVPLEANATTDAAAATIAQALLTHPHPLLVLDNFEQLPVGAALLVGRWVDALPHVIFLATSRTPLRLARECLHEVAPLAPDAALAMMVDRVEQKGGTVRRDDPHLPGVLERLAGYPLAIELAAVRAVTVGLKGLAESMTTLESGSLDVPDRHRTLAACFDWSWSRLDARAQGALVQCAAFRGGFTRPTALEVFGDDVLVLDVLVDRHLLFLRDGVEEPEEPRYDLLVVIRELVEATAQPDLQAARERHARSFADASYARVEALRFERRMDVLVWLRAERANVAAAFRHATESGTRARLALTLVEHDLADLMDRGSSSAVLDGAVDDARNEPELLAHALNLRAARSQRAARLDDAETDIAEALALTNGRERVALLRRRGMVAMAKGDRERAVASYQEALALTKVLEAPLEATLMNDIGLTLLRADLSAARRWLDRAITEARTTGQEYDWALAAGNRAILARDENQLAQAEALFRRVAVVMARFLRGRVTSWAAGGLSGVLLDLGQAEEAYEWARRERSEAETEGKVELGLYGTMHCVVAALSCGDLDAAESELEIGERQVELLPAWAWAHAFPFYRGVHVWMSGDRVRAASWFRTAFAQATSDPDARARYEVLRAAAEGRDPEVPEAPTSPKHRSELGHLLEVLGAEAPFPHERLETAFTRLVDRMVTT